MSNGRSARPGAPKARRPPSPSRSARSPSSPLPPSRRQGRACQLARTVTRSTTFSAGGPAADRGAERMGNERMLTGTEAIAAVATGAASVTDIVAGCLDRAAELEGAVGAFRILDEDGARSTAKRLDGCIAGPLHGLVVGIKDVIDTADLPTGYGSPLFDGHRPARDAEVVAALRRAGAIVLGKTESTEFAMYRPTRTRNPWDLARTPGGSSSGSAAAVAAGMVPVAFGTQTAGSVIRPAAYCGVYGFKPTRGWVSTSRIWRLSGGLP